MKENRKRTFFFLTISIIMLDLYQAFVTSINRHELTDHKFIPVDLSDSSGYKNIVIGMWIKTNEAGIVTPPVIQGNSKTTKYYGFTYGYFIDENLRVGSIENNIGGNVSNHDFSWTYYLFRFIYSININSATNLKPANNLMIYRSYSQTEFDSSNYAIIQ